MGATDFYTTVHGPTPEEAFKAAREEALHEYGHGGYTGTIAEKQTFIMVPLPEGVSPNDHAYNLVESHRRISDKWGPAGCMKLAEGVYYFFGIASE
jgi:hypothetical protein